MYFSAVLGSVATLPLYRSGANTAKPSFASASACCLTCVLRPHHSWIMMTPGNGPVPSGFDRYPAIWTLPRVAVTVRPVSPAGSATRSGCGWVAASRLGPACVVAAAKTNRPSEGSVDQAANANILFMNVLLGMRVTQGMRVDAGAYPTNATKLKRGRSAAPATPRGDAF